MTLGRVLCAILTKTAKRKLSSRSILVRLLSRVGRIAAMASRLIRRRICWFKVQWNTKLSRRNKCTLLRKLPRLLLGPRSQGIRSRKSCLRPTLSTGRSSKTSHRQWDPIRPRTATNLRCCSLLTRPKQRPLAPLFLASRKLISHRRYPTVCLQGGLLARCTKEPLSEKFIWSSLIID